MPDIKPDEAQELLDEAASIYRIAGFDVEKSRKAVLSKNFDIRKFIDDNSTRTMKYVSDSGFSGADHWFPEFSIGSKPREPDLDAPDQILAGVTLRDLNLIDIDKVSWEAVMEFRKDRKSQSALRDFRIFFLENFSGKSRNEIADRLSRCIDSYDITRRTWGFEAAKRSFSVAVSQQGLISSSVGTLSAALLGAPTIAIAAVGAAVTLGSCALEFGQIAVDRWKEENTRPTRYLTSLRKLGLR